ncbi:hypothetical protein MATL_G00154370 [Megalops atlanticus]|uniref:Uncharacterized protein n=1 Tax=Megalops atlanticus TaxID=7932 RepID=A0A9D3T395_MEGAT|nr:hypothetical protein MATL_G00154370 [Megalops atlanticus]
MLTLHWQAPPAAPSLSNTPTHTSARGPLQCLLSVDRSRGGEGASDDACDLAFPGLSEERRGGERAWTCRGGGIETGRLASWHLGGLSQTPASDRA